jgi:hypothetical protein
MVPEFYYENMATLLFVIILYLTYKLLSSDSDRYLALIILVCAAIVITHNYFSLLLLLYLSSVPIIFLIKKGPKGKFFVFNYKANQKKINMYLTVAGIFSIILFMWWSNFALSIWPYITGFPAHLASIISQGYLDLYLPGQAQLSVLPVSLKPLWGVTLLDARNVLMFVPVIFGFAILLMKGKKCLSQKYVLFTVFFAALELIIDSLVVWAGPYRAIFLFGPFIALCIGIFYDFIRQKLHRISIVILTVIIVIFVLAAQVGLWGYFYLPAQLYNPQVSLVNAGEHPPDWGRLNTFLNSYANFQNINSILTDEFYVTSLMVPTQDWTKIQVIGQKTAVLSENTMIIEVNGFNIIDSYIGQGAAQFFNSSWTQPGFNQTQAMQQFTVELNQNCNIVYNDKTNYIWWQQS